MRIVYFRRYFMQILFFWGVFIVSVFAQDSTTTRFAFVSDTQQPIWFEKIFLKANNNKAATDAIFSSIIESDNISNLFHLGDMTAYGMFNDEWDWMDINLKKLRQAKIPIYPALGNHDYYIFKHYALRQFRKRFPEIKNTWYIVKIRNLAVIILNSNYSSLTEDEIQTQKKWYLNKIEELDSDNNINGIVVGVHHSPFTNSKVVDPSADVQKDFVPPYIMSKKGKLFISGHAHAIEHFKQKGKDFLVIGGGGGLQHPLLMGSSQRWKDLFPIPTSKRMFHYLVCELKDSTLNLRVMMLNSDFKTFMFAYGFILETDK
ncbi:metallophosphoesterase [bacterium]|nr:metallophosphoesterase [bacterium]